MIRKLLMFGLLAALALLAACGGRPTPSSDSEAAPAGDSAAAPAAGGVSGGSNNQPVAKVQPTAESKSSGSTGAAAGETRDVQDISGSLDSLKSYRLQFTFAFDGKEE